MCAPGNQQLTGCGQGSSSKCMKSTTIHRLSDLPDGLLYDILSYMPAPEAVLSLWWCEVWKVVPALQANYESEFEDDDEYKFSSFVTRLLRRRARTAPLKVLTIYSRQSQDIDYLIKYARKKSVESLQIGDMTQSAGRRARP
jgi:hypothetical protein